MTRWFQLARSSEPELMDDLALQGPELVGTLEELEVINSALRGYAPTLDGLQDLLPAGLDRFSLLDVGAGGGDGARRIVDWAEGRGGAAEVLGIDLAETAVQHARTRCAGYPSIRFERLDLFEMGADPRFDVVHAAQVLHHFVGPDVIRALAQMLRLSRHGVVINDLHRHAVPWAFIKGATQALSRNRLIRYDAPLSVRRGFVRGELVEMGLSAGAASVDVTWCPLFRWRAVLKKA